MLSLMIALVLTACSPGAMSENSAGETSGIVVVSTVQVPALQPVTPSPSGTNDQAYPVPETGEMQAFSTGYPGEVLPGPPGNINGSTLGGYPGGTNGASPTGEGMVPSTPPAELTDLITAIARDLSRQSDTPMDEIAFISTEPVSWPDTSLGCPAPDLFYAEVITEGYLVTMAINGRPFEYHTDGGANFVLCRDGLPISTGSVP